MDEEALDLVLSILNIKIDANFSKYKTIVEEKIGTELPDFDFSQLQSKTIKTKVMKSRSFFGFMQSEGFVFEIDSTILTRLDSIEPKNFEIKYYICIYSFCCILSYFSTGEKDPVLFLRKAVIRLLCLYSDNSLSDVVLSSILFLYSSFLEEENIHMIDSVKSYFIDFIQQRSEFNHRMIGVLIKSLNYELNNNNGLQESLAPRIITIISMIIVDKPSFLNKNEIEYLAIVIKPFVFRFEEYCLGLFQHFHILMNEKMISNFLIEFVLSLPVVIEVNEPYISFNKRPIIQIFPSHSPANSFLFNRTSNRYIIDDFDPKSQNPFDAKCLIRPDLFSSASLLMKIISLSYYEISIFIKSLKDLIDQKQESMYIFDYIGFFSFSLYHLQLYNSLVEICLPSFFWDPSLIPESTLSKVQMYSIKYSAFIAILKQRSESLEVLLNNTAVYPELLCETLNILLFLVVDLAKYISFNNRIINLLRIVSVKLKENTDNGGYHESTMNAQILILRLFKSLFQCGDLIMIFLDHIYFGNYFLSLLLDEGFQSFVISQIKLYFGFNRVTPGFVSSLCVIINQIRIENPIQDSGLTIVYLLLSEMNASVKNIVPFLPLCDELLGLFLIDTKCEIFQKIIVESVLFFISVSQQSSLDGKYIDSLLNPLKMFQISDFLFLLLHQLCAGEFLSRVNTKIDIINPRALLLFLELFLEYRDMDIFNYIYGLCDYNEVNAVQCHKSWVDIRLLEIIPTLKGNQIDKALNSYCSIAKIVSSPFVVQKYISLLIPNDHKYLPNYHHYLLNPLKSLFYSSHSIPETTFPLKSSHEYMFSSNSKQSFFLTLWGFFDASTSDVIELSDSNTTFLTIRVLSFLIYANTVQLSCQVPKRKWVFIVFSISNGNVKVYFDSLLMNSFSIDVMLPKSNNVFIKIGGNKDSVSRFSRLQVYQYLSQVQIDTMYHQGPRFNKVQYAPFLLTNSSNHESTTMDPYFPSYRTFASVFVNDFGIDILLPLFAQLDLPMFDDSSNTLSILSILEIFASALLLSENEEIKFCESQGIQILSHLLISLSQKHITYDLYLALSSLLDACVTTIIKEELIENILLNFEIWIVASNEHHLKILTYMEINLYNSFFGICSEKLPILSLLHVLRVFYWYNPLESHQIRGYDQENHRNRDGMLDICTCRKTIMRIILNISIKSFRSNDFVSIISHCVTLPDLKQRLDMIYLIREISILNPCPLLLIDNQISTISRLHYVFNNSDDLTTCAAVMSIISVHRIVSSSTLSLNDHLEIIFHQISPRAFSKDLLCLFLKEIDNSPELFKICSFLSLCTDSFEMYNRLKPKKSYITSNGWCLWGVVCAVQNDSVRTKVYDFLLRCSETEWPNIFAAVEIVCRVFEIEREVQLCSLLSSMCSIGFEYRKSDVITFISCAVFHFLFFHEPSQNPHFKVLSLDTAFHTNFFNDFSQSESSDSTIENSWVFLRGSSSLVDKLLTKRLKKNPVVFSVSYDMNTKFRHLELAKNTLNVVAQIQSQESLEYAVAIASIIAPYEIEFVIAWSRLLNDFSKCKCYQYLRMRLDQLYSIESFESLNSITHLYKDSFHDYFFVLHGIEKALSKKCFEMALDVFRTDQTTAVDECVSFLSVFSEKIRIDIERNSKSWHRFWRNVSIAGGPWDPARMSEQINRVHWKRDNSLCAFMCPFKLKVNNHFDNHVKASFTRDIGNSNAAELAYNKYREDLAKQYELQAPPQIFEVQNDQERVSDELNVNNQKSKVFSFECEIISIKKVDNGMFNMYSDCIQIINEKTGKVKTLFYNEIVQILYRRRFHHKTAIEIFTLSGFSIYINFPKHSQSVIVSKISSFPLSNVKIIQKQDFPIFFKHLSFTNMWIEGKISNFEYLMKLNIYTGRTFNDPSLYPFLPWTYINYMDSTFNLNDPLSFRDLNKPVGALGDRRLEELSQRLSEMAQFKQVPFLYSSFAVCPLSIYLWFLRLEPFTTLHIDMQSGKFDHATRLFSSIQETYKLVTNHLNDYRELPPEFFFMSEFLMNENDFNLGKARDSIINDVILPKWAETSMEFVYLMRKSLESDYVSSNINNWIDLFWGYKQRGEEAIKANNVYLPNIYENVWTNDTLKDPMKRASIEAAMCHVGQMPPQVFNSPHPKRNIKKVVSYFSSQIIIKFNDLHIYESCIDPIDNVVYAYDGKFTRIFDTIHDQQQPFVERNRVKTDSVNTYISPCLYISNGKLVRFNNNEINHINPELTNISVAATSGSSYCVVSNTSTLAIFNLTSKFSIPFYGYGISCVDINTNFGQVVCGTLSGDIIICSMHEGSKVNLVSLNNSIPKKVLMTPSWGFIVTYVTETHAGCTNHHIYVHNVNGRFIRKTTIPSPVSSWYAYQDPQAFDYLVVGCEDGKVFSTEVFYASFQKPLMRCKSRVCSVSFKDNSHYIVTNDGRFIIIPCEIGI